MTEDTLARAAAAARDGDVDTLSAVLARSAEVVAARDAHGRTLLDIACRAATGDIQRQQQFFTPGRQMPFRQFGRQGLDGIPELNDGLPPRRVESRTSGFALFLRDVLNFRHKVPLLQQRQRIEGAVSQATVVFRCRFTNGSQGWRKFSGGFCGTNVREIREMARSQHMTDRRHPEATDRKGFMARC